MSSERHLWCYLLYYHKKLWNYHVARGNAVLIFLLIYHAILLGVFAYCKNPSRCIYRNLWNKRTSSLCSPTVNAHPPNSPNDLCHPDMAREVTCLISCPKYVSSAYLIIVRQKTLSAQSNPMKWAQNWDLQWMSWNALLNFYEDVISQKVAERERLPLLPPLLVAEEQNAREASHIKA